jgi:hypothetical protein
MKRIGIDGGGYRGFLRAYNERHHDTPESMAEDCLWHASEKALNGKRKS